MSTFTKDPVSGSIIFSDGINDFGLSPNLNVLPHPREADFIILSSDANYKKVSSGFSVEITKITSPTFIDRNDLISKLKKDFFFSVTGADYDARIAALENLTFKVAIYEEITAISGQISPPAGSSILLNGFADNVSAIISEIPGGTGTPPNFEDIGVDVINFDNSGNYTLSGALPSSPAALIYYISISLVDFGNLDITKVVEYSELSAFNEYNVIPILKFNEIEIYDTDNVTLRKKIFSTGFENYEFDDVLPSSQWIASASSAAPDLVSYTIGGVAFNFWSFDGVSTIEAMTNSFEIIHGIDVNALNTDIVKAEIHTHGFASNNNSGNVRILINMSYIPVDAAPIAYAPISIIIPISANQQYYHKVRGVEFNKPTSGFNVGDQILVKYTREPGNAADTYAADWGFLQCAIHMPFNSKGSRQRYIK